MPFLRGIFLNKKNIKFYNNYFLCYFLCITLKFYCKLIFKIFLEERFFKEFIPNEILVKLNLKKSLINFFLEAELYTTLKFFNN